MILWVQKMLALPVPLFYDKLSQMQDIEAKLDGL